MGATQGIRGGRHRNKRGTKEGQLENSKGSTGEQQRLLVREHPATKRAGGGGHRGDNNGGGTGHNRETAGGQGGDIRGTRRGQPGDNRRGRRRRRQRQRRRFLVFFLFLAAFGLLAALYLLLCACIILHNVAASIFFSRMLINPYISRTFTSFWVFSSI